MRIGWGLLRGSRLFQLLESEIEIVLLSDFVYVPLLMDLSIAEEIDAHSNDSEIRMGDGSDALGEIIRLKGACYIKAVHLKSVVSGLRAIHPEYDARIRQDLPGRGGGDPVVFSPPGTRLMIILTEIMPHFIHRKDRMDRPKLTGKDILELIERRIEVPPACRKDADEILGEGELHKLREGVKGRMAECLPLPEKPFPARLLKEWVTHSIQMQVLDEEQARIEDFRGSWANYPWMSDGHRAVIKYLSNKGSLELDGFGFFRSGAGDDFIVYRRTGEYALQDFFGRVYRFPDCRVAVTTFGPFKPYVLESYKHPFLESKGPGQSICLQQQGLHSRKFSAEAIIKALEEGINALFHGYDRRRRNGYHSLDPMTVHERSVRFEDLRIPRDHPDIRAGRLEIKNLFR